jgi:acid phosphatase type 7
MRRPAGLFLVSLVALAAAGCDREADPSGGQATGAESPSSQAVASAHGAPRVAAAGDVACAADNPNFNGGAGTATACAQQATAELILGRGYDALLALGDLQYPAGSVDSFRTTYEQTWGRLLELTRPIPGNHEYVTPQASGYFDYFGPRAGDPGAGWYAFEVGSWRVLALNSNCEIVGCGRRSPQGRWLRRDLRRHPTRCVLAMMHHPRFSSGPHGKHGPYRQVKPLWRALYGGGADVVISGHDHFYERFAPLRPGGSVDRRRGLTEFVAGTGGKSLYRFKRDWPQSRARERAFGVLELRLKPGRFDWRFVPVRGPVPDKGSRRCH